MHFADFFYLFILSVFGFRMLGAGFELNKCEGPVTIFTLAGPQMAKPCASRALNYPHLPVSYKLVLDQMGICEIMLQEIT